MDSFIPQVSENTVAQVHFEKSQDNQVDRFTHWAWRNVFEWIDMWEKLANMQEHKPLSQHKYMGLRHLPGLLNMEATPLLNND